MTLPCRQNNLDTEARMIYQEWIKIGIDRPFSDALDRAQTELESRLHGKWVAAIDIRKQRASEVENSRPARDGQAHEGATQDWRALHGHANPYPPDLVQNSNDDVIGGHAEENLIRAWASVTTGRLITHVDIFLTRMPCPDKSSSFRLGQTVYKEGCVTKLIQLVGEESDQVKWNIRYDQELNPESQVLAFTLAAGFPGNVDFRRRL